MEQKDDTYPAPLLRICNGHDDIKLTLGTLAMTMKEYQVIQPSERTTIMALPDVSAQIMVVCTA